MSRQHKTEMDAYKEGSIQLVMQGLTDAWEHTRFVDVFNEVTVMAGQTGVTDVDHDAAVTPTRHAITTPPRCVTIVHGGGGGQGDSGGLVDSFATTATPPDGGGGSPWRRSTQAGGSPQQAWWSMGEFLNPLLRTAAGGGIPGGGDPAGVLTHQSVRLTLTGSRVFPSDDAAAAAAAADMWDASDSLAELAADTRRRNAAGGGGGGAPARRKGGAPAVARDWLARDPANGYVRVYATDGHDRTGVLAPCTLTTSAHRLCLALGIAATGLHVQYGGGVVRRVDSHEHPLMMQHEHLVALGYTDMDRIQAEGATVDLAYLIRFYLGKPTFDSTFSRTQLRALIDIRKGKMLQAWQRRACVLSGTRLLIYKDLSQTNNPTVIQLAKGAVEAIKFKDHDLCLKLTSTLHGERCIILSFTNFDEFNKWHRKCKKATDKLPTTADLSHCHLEFLPEPIFINDKLSMLNLRHNALKERPIEEDIYTIGWLDDLPRFTQLRSLNLADNGLTSFPIALCAVKTLVELNIASNKLEFVPPQIAALSNLQALHIHNNHLSSLPDEMIGLKRLFILVLAFNHFPVIPAVVAQLTDVRASEVENIIMAGNQIASISMADVKRMRYVKKVDLRMNELRLTPQEVSRFATLEHLTHLDVRDNAVGELDLRVVRSLEFLNCERNCISELRLNGTALKCLYAAHNNIEVFAVTPKPEWLLQLNVAHNFLETLPDWLSDCFFLQKLTVSHNLLRVLPPKLLVDAKKLKVLRASHNHLLALSPDVDINFLEEVQLQHNNLTRLPAEFLSKSNKLRVLNLSKNRLSELPPLNANSDLNRVQELYLMSNCLGDAAVSVIAGYPRLKVLHLAYNEIETLSNRDISRLEMLQELNVSGNQLRSLPDSLGRLSKLVVIRAHSNMLKCLPDFKQATALRVLDVGHNQLLNISVTNLMASQINLLDMSLNTDLKVDPHEFKSVKSAKSVCLVDMTGQNRTLPGLGRWREEREAQEGTDPSQPWKVGFSETAGTRNKLCISMLRILKFGNENEAVFAMFDGGQNDEVPRLLCEEVPRILREELARPHNDEYMRYTLLEAHKCLRGAGQRLGAAGVLCHIRRDPPPSNAAAAARPGHPAGRYTLHIANVGDTQAVLCRGGDAVVLTRRFLTTDDVDECVRVHRSDGIITEDGKVNASTRCTRLLGSAYLNPHVIPDPCCRRVALQPDDEFVVIASGALWRCVSPAAAVDEVYETGNPIVAAKRLQDLAQACGARENVAALVVRLNTEAGPSLGRLRRHNRSMSIDDVDAAAAAAAASVRRRRGGPALVRYRSAEVSADDLCTSGDEFVRDSINIDGGAGLGGFVRCSRRASRRSCGDLSLRPLPRQLYVRRATAAGWQELLQRRLADDVKNKEMQQVSALFPGREGAPVAPPRRRRRRPSAGAIDIDVDANGDGYRNGSADVEAAVSCDSNSTFTESYDRLLRRTTSDASVTSGIVFVATRDPRHDVAPPRPLVNGRPKAAVKKKPPVPPRRSSNTAPTTTQRGTNGGGGGGGNTAAVMRPAPGGATNRVGIGVMRPTSSDPARLRTSGAPYGTQSTIVRASRPSVASTGETERAVTPRPGGATVGSPAVAPRRPQTRPAAYRRSVSEDCRQRRRLVTVERDERTSAAAGATAVQVVEFESEPVGSRVPGLTPRDAPSVTLKSDERARYASYDGICGVAEVNGNSAILVDDDVDGDDVTVVEIARL